LKRLGRTLSIEFSIRENTNKSWVKNCFLRIHRIFSFLNFDIKNDEITDDNMIGELKRDL
jgi:hypothetical protein